MSEAAKTAVFFVIALLAVGVAVATRPASERFNVETMVGKPLIEEFAVDAPRRLTVTRIDDATGEQRDFEVAEAKELWTIPSKAGYPADATAQMVSAVEGVIGREILQVATDQQGRHAEFGVLDPAGDNAAADAGAVGTRVRLIDKDEKPLADVVIGKEVKGTDGKQHYVRIATQDAVYAVEIDPASFSTDFSDWIEKDLLGLDPMDIKTISIDDYSSELRAVLENGRPVPVIMKDPRAQITVSLDDESSTWLVDSLESYDRKTKSYAPFQLGPNEELNSDALTAMKSALDDLKIVDVERKPAGLSADLKAGGEFMGNDKLEAMQNLAIRGFLPNPEGDSALVSSDGELVITQNNGVEYVLRFGQLQESTQDGDAAAAGADPAAEKPDTNDAGLNRYLFVMARFNDASIQRPELEELPPLPAEAPTPEAAATDTPAAEGEATAAAAPPAEAAAPNAEEVAKIRAERKAIEERNAEGLKRYEEQLAEGRKRVDELNLRFGDWYYVISNDVFKKIHLGRPEVIRTKAQTKPTVPGSGGAAAPPFGEAGGLVPGLPMLRGMVPPAPAGETPAESTEPVPAAETPAGESTEEPAAGPADDAPAGAASTGEEAPAGDAAADEAPAGGAVEPPAEAPVTEEPATP